MSTPLSLFLTDFGRPAPTLPGLPTFDEDPAEALLPLGPALDEQLADARREGYAEGEAAAREAAEAESADLQAAHEAALDAARDAWAAEQGEAMATLVGDGLAALEKAVTDALAALVEPLLHEAARAKACDEVREAVGALLAGGEGRLVTIRGPADLVAVLKGAVAASPSLAFEPDDEAAELTVTAGDTTIRSALQPWADRLRDAIAGAS